MFSQFVRLIQLLVILLVCSFSVNAQVSANFSSNITNGCSPVVVRFSDQSTGNIKSWKWKFGNGNTSTAQNPGAIYVNSGFYNVELTVSDGTNTDVISFNNYIQVFEAPEINISASQNLGCAPLSINFEDLSYPGSSPMNKWTWNFGDGGTSTQQNPTHVYRTPGIYSVTLVGENQNGCKSDSVFSQFIEVEALPNAQFTSDVQSSCQEPLSVNFVQQANNAIAYFWDFGDGQTSTQANPTHTYTSSGVFDVTLTATNASGCADVLSIPGYIAIEQLVTDFSASNTFACAGKDIQFTDLSTSNPDTWLWNFGDGRTSVDENPTHAYNSPGNYAVTLTTSNSASCWDSEEKTAYITVTNAPNADFAALNPSACAAPHTVNFTDLSINANSWEWDFGDGSPLSTDQNPSHTYTTEGQFDVTLRIGSLNGCKDTLVLQGYVSIESPIAEFSADTVRGCLPILSTFSNESTSGEPINQYNWDFGDGSTSSLPNPSHSYTVQGIYDVSLIIRNARGCYDTIVKPQFAAVGEKPDADFSYTPSVSCKSDPINFQNLTTPNSNQWLWEFGDGGFSSDKNPTYEYADTGTFSVTLIASMYGCRDTQSYENIITIHPPGANYTFERTCDNPFQISFKDASLAPDTWAWNFGDGNTSNDRSPVHIFDTAGVYSVSLLVTDTVYGCTDEFIQDIRIYDVKADFVSADTVVCNPSQVVFKNLSTDASKFRWTLNYGVSTAKDPKINFSGTGYYDILLIATDANGCIDSMFKEDYILVQGPTANFGATPTTGCAPLNVGFIDSSTSLGGAIVKYAWEFGDGGIDSVQNPVHVYNNSLSQDVTLTVEDENGCVDKIVKSDMISPSRPIASFSADELSCTGKAVAFIDSSIGNGLSYFWDFGDGNTSSQVAPIHEYEFEGAYSITLTVTDTFGCDSTLVKTDYVVVSDPVANFYADSVFSPCPPLLVHFTDSSKGSITQWEWDFGNGGTSIIHEPSNVYTHAGEYSVQLIVTNSVGCKDTIKKDDLVVVLGPNGTFEFTPKNGCLGNEVYFNAQTSNSVENTWDFGDGTLFKGNDTAMHIYPNSGYFKPTLVLDDGQGCLFTVTSEDSVLVGDMNAAFIVDTSYLCKSGDIQFGDLSTGFPNITSWNWSFGDGNSSTSQNPSHHYDSSGVYTVRLVVSNDYCSDTLTKEAFINVDKGPQANFKNEGLKCVPADIDFIDLSQSDSSLATWNWDFGNGLSDTLQNSITQYSNAGSYSVQLIVASVTGCADTIVKNIDINPYPIADAGNDTSICSYESLVLNGQGGMYHLWSPSLGLNNSTIANPVAQPDSTTDYILTVSDTLGCSSKDTMTLTVYYPPVINASQDASICVGEEYEISVSGGDFYTWSPNSSCPSCATTTVKPSVSTNFIVEVSNMDGCVSRDSVLITVNPIPEGIIRNDTAICAGESITLDIAGANTYKWLENGNNSLSCEDCPSPIASPKDTSRYIVELTNQYNCSSTDSITIAVKPLPVASIIAVSESCEMQKVNLQASGGIGYQWVGNTSGLACTTCDSTSFVIEEDRQFTVEVTNTHGCTDQETVNIIARPLPDVKTIEDATLCAGDEITLNTVSNTGIKFQWNQPKVLSDGNVLSPVANPEESIQLVITAYNQYDCANSDTLNLEVISSVSANALSDTTICIGNSVPLKTEILAESYLGSKVSWSPINFLSDASDLAPLSTPNRSIAYTRIVESGACSADTQKVNITVNNLPDLAIEEPARSVNGGSVTLNSKSSHFASSYEWGPAEYLNCTTCENPEWYVDQDEMEFTLKFTDNNGCVAYDSIKVKSAGDCGDNFYIPNTFSPNKDEINDVLYVRGHGVVELNYFRIFDRWGNEVFQSNDMNTGWNGFYNGRMMNPAVFVYVMEGVCSNGQLVRKKGNVALIR